MYTTDGGPGVLVGRRRYSTRVENYDFRLRSGGGARQAAIKQLPLDRRAISLGRTTSEVLHVIGRHRLIILSAKLRRSFERGYSGCSITLTSIEMRRLQRSNQKQSSWHPK